MDRRAYKGRQKEKKKVLRRSGKAPVLHCMLVPTEPEPLLLPTSVMAEVIDFQPPRPTEDAPPWLLGEVDWENRQVPVFSFGALINGTEVGDIPKRARIMILKSLTDSTRVPYLGLLMSDLPRPVQIEQSDLVETGDDKKSLGVFSHVRFEKENAIIPDMDRLAHLVTHATFGALPITRLDA
ncbi:MAG: chemotaxis protein CheW [Gammaproteobacteria bacterium]|nr:chemotaxis protein CheW [Gammaproteobacteria bacterium]NNJ80376.1 chemotaxis protein CheW [Xanthomonadales bacterium]